MYVTVERQVEHESESNWQQLGSLASGVLRMAAEKRMKQAEFMVAEKGAFETPLQPSQADSRIQFVLPLTPPAKPLVHVSTGHV